MNQKRLEQLLNYLNNEPEDPFVLYAIANEYLESSPEKARQYFETLLKKYPEYLPTYYLAAQLYADFAEEERAEETYKKGIALATKNNELKTLAELKNAYQNFLFEKE